VEIVSCKVRVLLAFYHHLVESVCRNEKWKNLFGEVGMYGAGRAIVYEIADTLFGFVLSLLLTWHSFSSLKIALAMSMTPIALCLPLLMWQKGRIRRFTREYLKWKRMRWRAVEEMVNNLRCVKLLAMESVVEKKVLGMRDAEVKELIRKDYFVATNNWIWQVLPVLLTGVLIAAWYQRGFDCTSNCFMAFSLIHNFAFPLKTIPKIFSMNSSQALAQKQLRQLTGSSGTFVTSHHSNETRSTTYDAVVDFSINNSSFSFVNNINVLHDISIQIQRGQFVGVCGPVASGKSALLHSLMGELKCESNDMKQGWHQAPNLCVAYVSQYPWLLNDTIRNNILLGRDMDWHVYNACLDICGLTTDLLKIPNGDETITGFHGDFLSGGQQIRVTLARGIYSLTNDRPQALILDDVFANVDDAMREKMLDQIIFGSYRNSTRILATHNLELLQKADIIYVLDEGRVHSKGTFSELVKSSPLFSSLLSNKYQQPAIAEPASVQDEPTLSMEQTLTETSTDEQSYQELSTPPCSESSQSFNARDVLKSSKACLTALFYYLSAFSFFQFLFIVGSTFATVILEHIATTMITLRLSETVLSLTSARSYLLISLIQLTFSLMTNITASTFFNNSAKKIHNQVFQAILQAEMSALPLKMGTGEVMSLMTEDTQTMDADVKEKFRTLMNTLIQALVNIILIVHFVPKSVVLLVPMILSYIILPVRIHGQLIHNEKEKKQLISQIISSVTETFAGSAIIRSFDAQKWMQDNFFTKVRAWQQIEIEFNQLQIWYAFQIHVAAAVLVTVLSWFSSHHTLQYSSTVVMSVLISSCMRLLQSLRDTGIEFQLFIQALHSLRRLRHQKESLSSEHAAGEEMEILKTSNNPPSLVFKNVSMRYGEGLPLVLKNVSFAVGGVGPKRVGLIGRSASGKTSVMNCVWKMCSLASGEIMINSRSIEDVSLESLRKKVLCIVPQHPVLFEGTIRECVDPDEKYTQEVINQVMSIVGLGSLNLHKYVDVSGKNLSVGTRQLLSLARILLHKKHHPQNQFIVFLDEATAFVDKPTVNIIHNILKEHFCDCTIVVISHSLESISSFCDSVILLQNGKLVLHDIPERVILAYQSGGSDGRNE